MDWITAISNVFTSLKDISKERLMTLLLVSLCVLLYWFQYNENLSLNAYKVEHDAKCSEMISKVRSLS